MSESDVWEVALASLQLASRLIESIQQGVGAAGYPEVRPMHGFAFMRIAAGDATTARLAEHLGVSKQAAAQLVERMVRDGNIARVAHPADQRARLLRLTTRGWRITAVAEDAARRAVEGWREELPVEDAAAFERALRALTAGVREVRPTSFGA